MQELKEAIRAILKDSSDEWVKAIRKAEEIGEGIDLVPVLEKQSGYWIRLDNALSEFDLRNKAKKKGLWR